MFYKAVSAHFTERISLHNSPTGQTRDLARLGETTTTHFSNPLNNQTAVNTNYLGQFPVPGFVRRDSGIVQGSSFNVQRNSGIVRTHLALSEVVLEPLHDVAWGKNATIGGIIYLSTLVILLCFEVNNVVLYCCYFGLFHDYILLFFFIFVSQRCCWNRCNYSDLVIFKMMDCFH